MVVTDHRAFFKLIVRLNNSIKENGWWMYGNSKQSKAGLTLLEILVVITVIAILAAISVPSYEAFRRRASKAVCISQMRVLHVALDSYMLEYKHWPQIPPGIFYSNEESHFWEWWMTTLEPYGGGQEFWLCPEDKVSKESPDEHVGSYMPTKFDGHNFTPYRWSAQPWLMERGNLHKKGAHILMQDGSVRNSTDMF